MSKPRRLIESRLPLQEISQASAREKSIRHGHISTLHIWWARRPLAASRAAVFATLVPDSDENYELVKKIAPWEAVKNGNSPEINEARRRVLEAFGGRAPRVLDPFAGGGAIPLEALRLGCETYALDLNPVAYLILKATLEYPQRFGQPHSRPVPAYIRAKDEQQKYQQKSALGTEEGEWTHAYQQNPLATEVRYWGEWVLQQAQAELAAFYPPDPDGKRPVAYLWARTVTCTNPTCRAEVPLVRQWWLAKKDKKRLALKPCVDASTKTISFAVVEVPPSDNWPDKGTVERGNATCLVCGTTISNNEVKIQGSSGQIGQRLLAVVLSPLDGDGKLYQIGRDSHLEPYLRAQETLVKKLGELDSFFSIGEQVLDVLPTEPIHVADKRNFWVGEYGIETWAQLFNPRQALALVTFAKWVRQAYTQMLQEGMDQELARVVVTYLGIAVDRLADKNAVLVVWHNTHEKVEHVFGRQALPMVWDYAEASIFADIAWSNPVEWVCKSIEHLGAASSVSSQVSRTTATSLPFADNFFDAIITDPPYYDAVPYADLSDFFYVWLKRTIGHLYPEHFRTPLTPKSEEIVQNPVRHGGDSKKARQFFETKMAQAFREMHRVLKPGGKATIVFAHKSTEAWETLISGLITAGFQVEASWPLHTEMQTRLRARNSAALASSTFLSCTKREPGRVGWFAQVRANMQQLIQPKLQQFWDMGIRGADFFMSAIGPGLEAFSRYDTVKRADGRTITVGEFLDEVRKIVLDFVLERVVGTQSAGIVDGPTQFALLALWAYGYELPSDEARKLAQSTGVDLSTQGSLVHIKGERTRLLGARERLKKDKDFGRPQMAGRGVPMIDALHWSVILLPQAGRQGVADYLQQVGYLQQPNFWLVAQALAEILNGQQEGRDLHELLTYRDSLAQMVQRQGSLFS